jgi:hypothetical protein
VGKHKKELEDANEIVGFQDLNCIQELTFVFKLEV